MSVSPITYENFQTARQIWAGDGGPWKGTYDPMNARVMPLISSSEAYCDGSCLVFALAPRPPTPIYQLTATANISVDMTQYGSANNLDFTWTFLPGYDLADVPAGASIPIHTQINDVGLDDSVFVLASDFFTNPNRVWPGNLISRAGTVSLTPGSDGRSFISIVMSLTTLPTNNTFMELLIKDVSFKITTPTALASSSSSSTRASSTSSLSSSSSGTSSGSQSTSLPFTSGGPSVSLSDFSERPQPSSTGSAPSVETAKISTAAIGGLAIGIVALVALFVITLLLYRKRRRRHASSDSLAHEPFTHESNTYPMEKYPPPRLNGIIPSSSGPYQIPMLAASPITSAPATTLASPIPPPARSTYSAYNAGTSTMGREPPPMYDNADGYVSEDDDETEDPSPLAVFANSHRELISEDLEARLEAAGYLPTVDPDSLPEEEWLSLHNVTKLEVMRLQRLYQMERQRTNWQQPKSPSGGMR